MITLISMLTVTVLGRDYYRGYDNPQTLRTVSIRGTSQNLGLKAFRASCAWVLG